MSEAEPSMKIFASKLVVNGKTEKVGAFVGALVGAVVGSGEGRMVVGDRVGEADGLGELGARELGARVGIADGDLPTTGEIVGQWADVGDTEGEKVDRVVGFAELEGLPEILGALGNCVPLTVLGAQEGFEVAETLGALEATAGDGISVEGAAGELVNTIVGLTERDGQLETAGAVGDWVPLMVLGAQEGLDALGVLGI